MTFSSDATGKATVTQVGPSKFAYDLKPGSVQVPGEVVDDAIEKQLIAEGIPNAIVNGPQDIIVTVVTTVTCNITGAQGAATSTVTSPSAAPRGRRSVVCDDGVRAWSRGTGAST